MQDHEIIDLYWERNEQAISATAEKYKNYCHSIAYNILHNNEDAEECVNDTWLNAWKSIPPHRPERLSTFLGKITRNLSLDRYKKLQAEKRGSGQTELTLSELEDCIPDNSCVENSLNEQILTQVINEFLYSQPEQNRNIFIRRYWYLFSIKEISTYYGMSESKVTSLLFRMRNNLRTRLEKEGISL